ncbi:MAG TPA: hypothetical protein VF163_19110, partial [Micromonosporaceae bacterium]
MVSTRVLRVLIGSRIRSQLAYRSNFGLDLLGTLLLGALELMEIYLLLANTPTLGGLTLTQAALVYALATLAFSLAEMAI